MSYPRCRAFQESSILTDDMSSLYGNSEEILGRWFKQTGKRDQIFLASKFGYACPEISMQP